MKHRNPITKRALLGTLISMSICALQSTQASDQVDSGLATAGVQRVQCPENLLRDPSVRKATQIDATLARRHGEHVVISRHRVDSAAECLLQTAPTLMALPPDDPAVHAEPRHESPAPKYSGIDTKDKSASCGFQSPVATIYAGRCGVSGKRVGSAWFATSHLALTGGEFIGRYDEVCLAAGGKLLDVHQIRRSGSGAETVAGLSLMQPAARSVGARYVTGPLNSTGGAGIRLGVEGTIGAEAGCHSGFGASDDGTFASFFWTSYTLERPQYMNIGGPAFVGDQNAVPMGTHVAYRVEAPSGTNHVYPVLRRFKAADIDVISAWANTSVPAQPVTITSPGYGAVVNSNVPLQVSVSATGTTLLELDGVPVANPITNLEPGTHRLVAYSAGAPQFRHTILFDAQPQIVADAHETDDLPEQWKPLWENQRKYHTFHRAGDVDWSAFGIGAGTRMNLSLTGSAFGQCAMTLYLHPNYPTGMRQAVQSIVGSCASLSMDAVSPVSPSSHVYFLETTLLGSATGNNTNYSLLIQSSPEPIAADAFEVDDTRAQFKALYGGQPQQHNFHRAGDADWTAFAVGPGVPVRVTVSGLAAERSRIRLFRQVDYPNGPIVEVAMREAASPLVVTDQINHAGPYTVYYVETAAIWSGFHGIASTYRISVE